MCDMEKQIYGITYKFYGFQDVDRLLPNGKGAITTLGNNALDQWFGYFSTLMEQEKKQEKPEQVLVVNPPYEDMPESIRKSIPESIQKDIPDDLLSQIEKKRSTAPILGAQYRNILLIDYEKTEKKMERQDVGDKYFFALLMHESTHLLEDYLTGVSSANLCSRLKGEDKRAEKFKTEVSIKGTRGWYLEELADYQGKDMGTEGLACLVEALTFLTLQEPESDMIGRLGAKLMNAITIARENGVLPCEKNAG